MSGAPADPGAVPRHALATLRHRDFRLLWVGQLVSTVGDAMQLLGISWHMYVLTNSPIQLGLLGLVRAVPFMALSMMGGALADSIERKRLLMITQTGQMVLTTGLVIATVSNNVTVWLLYVVTFLSGAASAFDQPARQAMIPNVVPRVELPGAMTLITILRRTALIVGPGIAGLIIGQFGLAPTYFGNALSFLAVIVAVLLMGPVPHVAPAPATNPLDRILAGFHFARAEPLVLLPMLLDFFTRGVCNFNTLLPIFAKDIYAVGAQGFGVLSAASSVGAVGGGLVLAGLRIKRPIWPMMAAYGFEAMLLAAFGLSHYFAVGLLVLVVRGVANVVGEVERVTVLQLKTPDNVRGRVTALSNIFDLGGPQVGQADAGVLATFLGPVEAALAGGAATFGIVCYFLFGTPIRDALWEPTEQLAGEPA